MRVLGLSLAIPSGCMGASVLWVGIRNWSPCAGFLPLLDYCFNASRIKAHYERIGRHVNVVFLQEIAL